MHAAITKTKRLGVPNVSDREEDVSGQHKALAFPLVPTKTLLLTGDNVETKRQEIRRYFHQTCQLYDGLLALIKNEDSFFNRYEPLRHPLIFYFAHPAVFYINKLIAGRFISKRLDPAIEAMMAVGVDEMSWDDLNTHNYAWPTVEEVRAYRMAVRARVDEFILAMPIELPIRQESAAWIVLMGIEHERIHLETSSMIMRQMPLAELRSGNELSFAEQQLWARCPFHGTSPGNTWKEVSAHTVRLGKRADDATFGWDNEYGVLDVKVNSFQASRQLVSNQEYFEFVEHGGYEQKQWWTEEGLGWLAYTHAQHPRFWILRDGVMHQRHLLDETPLPLNWPVEVNCLEAQAYCAWKAAQTGLGVKLPSESQWHAIRETLLTDQPYWENAPGNINLEHFASPSPVDHFLQGDFFDIIGNVWQWTRTPIQPFPGFEVHSLYDDFSVPTFDGRHNLMKGGSWISTGNESIKSARYAFRRHFFQHAGFRMVIDDSVESAITEGSKIYETDQSVTQYLEFHYGPEALGVRNFPVACIDRAMQHSAGHNRERCLDIGCSVGRSSFELAQYFAHVDAIDFSARFIQAGVRLQQGEQVLYEIQTEGDLTTSRAISLQSLGLDQVGNRVGFMQGDACNLKPQYSDYDLVFAGNLIDRLYDPTLFLRGISSRLLPGGHLVITSPYTWLEEYTQKSHWLGGRREHGEPLTTFEGLERLLSETFTLVAREDLPFVIRETARKHQHTIAEMTVWRKNKN